MNIDCNDLANKLYLMQSQNCYAVNEHLQLTFILSETYVVAVTYV